MVSDVLAVGLFVNFYEQLLIKLMFRWEGNIKALKG